MSSDPPIRESRKGKERHAPSAPSNEEMAEQVTYFKRKLGELMKARDIEKQKHSEKTEHVQEFLSSAQSDLLASKQSVQSLQSQLAIQNRELAALREDLLTARTRNDGLQTRLSKNSGAGGEDVEREWRRMKAELGKMEKEKMGWEKERLDLVEGLKREKKRVERAVEDAQVLKNQTEKDLKKEMKDKNKENEEKNEALIEEVKIAKQLLNATAYRHASLQREYQTLRRMMSEERIISKSEIQALQSQITISLEDRKELSRELKQERRSRTQHERHLLEENSILRRRLHAERKDFAVWRKDTDSLHRSNNEHVRVLSENITLDQDTTILDGEAKLDQLLLEDERDQARALNVALQADISRLQSDVSSAQAALQITTTSLSSTQSHLNTLQSNHTTLQSTHASNLIELTRLQMDNDKLMKDMKAERGKWDERKEVVRRLGGEVGMIGMAKKALEEECDRLRQSLSFAKEIEEAYAALQLKHEILLCRMDSYQSEAREMGNLNASLRGFPSDEVAGRVGYVQGLREDIGEMREALIATKAQLAASRTKVVSLTKELDIYRSQELPLHVKPVTKRIQVGRVPISKEREALGVSQGANIRR